MNDKPASGMSADSLSLSANALLNGSPGTVRIKSLQRVVQCKPAKMKQLALLVDLFDKIVSRLDAEHLSAIIDMVADAQRGKIAAGDDPNALPYAELSATELVVRAKERVNVVAKLVNALLEELPNLVAAFSDITGEEFGELDIDEGAAVMLAIFTVNYAFFTQSLPQTFAGYMQTWASKNPEKSAAVKQVVRRTVSRK